MPGAHECLENEVCLPEPDWKALLVWLDEITLWAETYEDLCTSDKDE